MRKTIMFAATIGMALCMVACGSKSTEKKNQETEVQKNVSGEEDKSAEEKESAEEKKTEKGDDEKDKSDVKEDTKKEKTEDAYIGEYKDNDNSVVAMEIAKGDKENYIVQIAIHRLASFTDGIGTLTEDGMKFTATDPEGNPISGIITIDENMAKVTFTDSTWSLLEENSSYEFEKMSDKPELWEDEYDQEETEEYRDASYRHFDRGVYVAEPHKELKDVYCFYDKDSGKVYQSGGYGLGFTCEQTRDTIVFHIGSADDRTVMKMSYDDNGNIVGTMEDTGVAYTFYEVEGEDPESFDFETWKRGN